MPRRDGKKFPPDFLVTVDPARRNQKSSAAIPTDEHQYQQLFVQQNRSAELKQSDTEVESTIKRGSPPP